MTCGKLVAINELPGGADLVLANCDANLLAQEIEQFFLAHGYRCEGGGPGNALYGIGSDVWRILFGAFARRYKFSAVVMVQPPHSILRIEKAMSGAMGGVIGYSAMKKETARIMNDLRRHFGAAPAA